MDTKQTCKICNRSFANGKAMGGHMRSHLVKNRLPPKPIPPVYHQPEEPSTKSLSSSSLSYPLSNRNAMQSYKSVNNELGTDYYDNESEEDSLKNPIRKRFQRSCKSADKASGSNEKVTYSPEQVSSISNKFSVEDAAMCLIKLSKDKWTKIEPRAVRKRVVYEFTQRMERVKAQKEEEDDNDDEWFCETRSRWKPKRREYQYRCEKCNKGFRSYQALGGHKASHSKIKTHIQKEEESEEKGSDGDNVSAAGAVTGQSSFKCPLCDKFFESRQALGGHKKVHFSYTLNATKSSDVSLLDLNLPAPKAREDEANLARLAHFVLSSS